MVRLSQQGMWVVILYLVKNRNKLFSKMKKRIASLLVCVCLFTISASSQSRKDYDNAEALAKEATSRLMAGDIKAGEELISRSMNLYPTYSIYLYAFTLMKLSDVTGANAVLNRAVEKIKLFRKDEILVHWITVEKMERNTAIVFFKSLIVLINKHNGNRELLINSISSSQEPLLKKENTTHQQVYELQLSLKTQLLALKGEFDEAIKITRQRPIGLYYLPENQKADLWYFATAKGDFTEALEIAKTSDQHRVGHMLMAYISLEDDKNSLDYYEQYEKIATKTVISNYLKARIDLNKKDYRSALINYDIFIKAKMDNKNQVSVVGALQNWEDYKLLGDIYAGLNNYEKARDYYNISLLYYPEYKPSMVALTALEVKYANETSADKTAPIILITEPAPNRGLEIVFAGNDILVKGTAADPSGLKSVTINGLVVYAQTDGNFWGNVPLKAGVNKIIVIATDGAGNASEHTFEIEKKSAVANSAIVPATTKEGKNYCLLISAQNYEDINIPSLENPIQDAMKLKIILKKDYGFDDGTIFSLFNPSANDVKRQLLELTNVIQPEDNLLIFYAGHGIWVEKEKKGYWLLIDAKRNDPNTWLQNKDVLNLIAKLPSRHTLLITDACFSGGVFKTRSIGKDAPLVLQTMNQKISRVAITSGNDTEVPDESVFMKYLVKALTENKEKYLTAQKMFITQIMEAVMTETKTEPRYGTLELAGHIGGDFIFSKK